MPRLLYLLALCNLVIGTGAFVLSGILQPLSAALGTSVAATGQAMTVYALSTAVLAPLALMFSGRWPRRRAMCVGLVLFGLGNLACAFATHLGWLFAARALMGVGAVFTPLAAGIAVAMVEPAQRGRALSLVFLGMSLSYVIGVPLGAWLAFRFGWQWPFVLIATLSLLAAITLALVMPRNLAAPSANFAGVSTVLKQGTVLWTLSFTLLYFMAIFTVFSYIGPVLQSLYPMTHERMSATLVMFGLSGVAGTLIGGWANDRFGTRRTLALQMTVFGIAMAMVPLTRGHYPLLVTAFIVWGIAGFGMMTPQQARLAALAPAQAPLLFSLNTSMLYIGTALGAMVGGAFSGVVGMAQLPWLGVPMVALSLVTLWITARKPATLQPVQAAVG